VETRQHRLARDVDDLGPRGPRIGVELLGGSDGDDRGAVHQHGARVHDLAPPDHGQDDPVAQEN
jgi:hypothetical protein